jgi:hypothetical protein
MRPGLAVKLPSMQSQSMRRSWTESGEVDVPYVGFRWAKARPSAERKPTLLNMKDLLQNVTRIKDLAGDFFEDS